jgi:8-amino-3,8-dideoxy-alpha-D-manno-octulosonate transaminase
MPGYELFGEDERRAVNELFDANNGVMFAHGFIGQRKGIFKVREFEKALAADLGTAHCQVVSSGSAALLVGLKALGIKPGDEVITTSFTFIATVEAIFEAGATPVLTEIDDTYNMDPLDFEAKITPRTKAVIPVHMAGAPARMDKILAVARKHGLKVLEDSAQAFGGSFGGKTLGTLGDAGCYSFDFAKNITTGEGGAVVMNSKDVYEIAREYHDHGHMYNTSVPRGRDTRRASGFNYRMTELQAAIGLVQLKKLPKLLAAHRANGAALLKALSGLGLKFRTIVGEEIADTLIFSLESKAAALKLAEHLGKESVGTKNLPDAVDWHFAGTWEHMFPGKTGQWPRSKDLLERSIALPVNALMTPDEIARVAAAVKAGLPAAASRG